MNELKETLNQVAETHFGEKEWRGITPAVGVRPDDLEVLAKKWADYCLTELRGELLSRGLNISKALVSFVDELKNPNASNA